MTCASAKRQRPKSRTSLSRSFIHLYISIHLALSPPCSHIGHRPRPWLCLWPRSRCARALSRPPSTRCRSPSLSVSVSLCQSLSVSLSLSLARSLAPSLGARACGLTLRACLSLSLSLSLALPLSLALYSPTTNLLIKLLRPSPVLAFLAATSPPSPNHDTACNRSPWKTSRPCSTR